MHSNYNNALISPCYGQPYTRHTTTWCATRHVLVFRRLLWEDSVFSHSPGWVIVHHGCLMETRTQALPSPGLWACRPLQAVKQVSRFPKVIVICSQDTLRPPQHKTSVHLCSSILCGQERRKGEEYGGTQQLAKGLWAGSEGRPGPVQQDAGCIVSCSFCLQEVPAKPERRATHHRNPPVSEVFRIVSSEATSRMEGIRT